MAMQYGDIAKAYDPLGMAFELGEIKLVYDPGGSITAPCAHDGFDLFVVQHLLQVGPSFFISTAKGKVAGANGFAYPYTEIPAFEDAYGRLDVFPFNITGRAGDPDNIAGLQVRRVAMFRFIRITNG
jgi:hypothetical protein